MDKELKKEISQLRAEFSLGKNGITQTFLESIDKYLTAHNMVKIKVPIAEDKDALKYYANEVAKEVEATLVEKKGFTFALYRKE